MQANRRQAAARTGAAKRADPRLAAFARLLARTAARRDFEGELKERRDGAKLPDSAARGKSP